ncbi:MAG: leucyl aminopeptidase, partial [Novosphingobium sp.]|nr:leucyl aminopeptidase [Novosphingobium sp.]
MQIEIVDAFSSPSPRLFARVVNQDAIPADLEPVLAEAARASRFGGKAGQLFEGFVERGGQVVRVALAGIGKPDADDRRSAIERAGAAIVAKYLTSGETKLGIDATGAGLSAHDAAALLLGARLRSFRLDTYRTTLKDEQKPSLGAIELVGAPAGTAEAWAMEAAVAEGVEFTKELVTEPANAIFPQTFVERCHTRLFGTGITFRVLDVHQMEALGMGALLGVAQGSMRPPRLLAMEWNGGKSGEKPVAFVGKGVTFDSGGISIKPAAGMEDMKGDM